jgi:hypothetical protein
MALDEMKFISFAGGLSTGNGAYLSFRDTPVGEPNASGDDAEGFLHSLSSGRLYLDQDTAVRGYNTGAMRVVAKTLEVPAVGRLPLVSYRFLTQDVTEDDNVPLLQQRGFYNVRFNITETTTKVSLVARPQVGTPFTLFTSTAAHASNVRRTCVVEWTMSDDPAINPLPAIQIIARYGFAVDFSDLNVILCQSIDYGDTSLTSGVIDGRYLNGRVFDEVAQVWKPADLLQAQVEAMDLQFGEFDDPQFISGD